MFRMPAARAASFFQLFRLEEKNFGQESFLGPQKKFVLGIFFGQEFFVGPGKNFVAKKNFVLKKNWCA